MFAGLKNFIYRHKKKFIISGVVIGSSILLSKFAQKRFIEWQEKEAKEFLKTTRRQYLFENTERTCNQTIISLSSQVESEVFKYLDTETILEQLRTKKDDNKLERWEELKIITFARHSALLYCGLMLAVVLKVQVNVIGGQLLIDSFDSSDSNLQEDYLSLCQYFIKTGVREVCKLIEKHVRVVFGKISLNSKLTLNDIEHIFWSIQSSISEDEFDPLNNLSMYLFSPDRKQFNNHASQRDLENCVRQTRELLESDEVVSLCQSCLGRAYSNSIDTLADYFVVKNINEQEDDDEDDGARNLIVNGAKGSHGFIHPNKICIPLAKIIPIVHGLTKFNSSNKEFLPWIHQFIIMEKIKLLGAQVFDNFAD